MALFSGERKPQENHVEIVDTRWEDFWSHLVVRAGGRVSSVGDVAQQAEVSIATLRRLQADASLQPPSKVDVGGRLMDVDAVAELTRTLEGAKPFDGTNEGRGDGFVWGIAQLRAALARLV